MNSNSILRIREVRNNGTVVRRPTPKLHQKGVFSMVRQNEDTLPTPGILSLVNGLHGIKWFAPRFV